MKIVADKNIPFVREAFSALGELTTLGSTEIVPATVRDAEILVVRSETAVDRTLLEGSPVRFVATVTIGTDHIDLEYLRSQGIQYASAPGSNANSVKEYVVAALLVLATGGHYSLKGKTLGVIGVGNVGSRVARAARGLGMEVLENDPPLARQTGDARFVALDRLMDCDIITLHVPLTKTGEDPTYHLVDEARLRAMKPGTILINTSRGAVVESGALAAALREKRCAAAVLDVWENEPAIETALCALAAIGTAHIAGYSLDGKLNAVRMAREALCRFLGAEGNAWDPSPLLAGSEARTARVPENAATTEDALHAAVTQCYDICLDDRLLRQLASAGSAQERSVMFRRLRAGYRLRREFSAVELPGKLAPLADQLAAIGFTRVITI